MDRIEFDYWSSFIMHESSNLRHERNEEKKFFFFFFFYVPHMILCFCVRLWRSSSRFLLVLYSQGSHVYHVGPVGLPATMDACLSDASCFSKDARKFVPYPHGRQTYFVSEKMSPDFSSCSIFFLCVADFSCFFRADRSPPTKLQGWQEYGTS